MTPHEIAESLHVGPDEVLVLRLSEATDEAFADDLVAEIDRLGLAGRALVIRADGVEMAAVSKA